MKLQGGIQNGYCKAAAAEKVHPESLERILNGLRLLVVPDQKEGAHGCDLPEEIHPAHIVAEKQSEHRTKEYEEHRKEPVGALRVVTMMLMIVLDVSNGIDADQTADDADHKTHDHGQIINMKMSRSLRHSSGQIQPDDRKRTCNGQKHCINLLISNGIENDHSHQNEFAGHDQHIRRLCLRQKGIVFLPSENAYRQVNDRCHDRKSGTLHQILAQLIHLLAAAHCKKHQCNRKREKDQKLNNPHNIPSCYSADFESK